MLNLVGKEAPDFTASAVMENNEIRRDFTLSSLRGKYVVLFFYPLDFTFVCPSEILAFNEKLEEFKTRNTDIIGVSVDSVNSHLAWKNTTVDDGGIGQINYPLISDLKKDIARSYGVLLDEEAAIRGLFLIDREGIVRHVTLNDDALGRNVTETLRMVDALRFHEEKGQVCPANWQKGQEGMTPSREGVIDYLSKFSKKETDKNPS